jgi:hypothetical protein
MGWPIDVERMCGFDLRGRDTHVVNGAGDESRSHAITDPARHGNSSHYDYDYDYDYDYHYDATDAAAAGQYRVAGGQWDGAAG